MLQLEKWNRIDTRYGARYDSTIVSGELEYNIDTYLSKYIEYSGTIILFLKRVIEKSLGPTCNVKQRIKKKSLVKLSWWMGALKMEKSVRS